MIPQFHFTGARKIMNMAKLGTVSALGNSFHSTTKPNGIKVFSVRIYTLCEFYSIWIGSSGHFKALYICTFSICYTTPRNNRLKFWLVAFPTSSKVMLRSLAISSATCFT
jgi:hypothetical protein